MQLARASQHGRIIFVANKEGSVNSIDEILGPESQDLTTETWRAELADKIAEILDRKRSSIQGREKSLTGYIRILTGQYAAEEIRGRETELVVALLKSIKSETSEKETVLAIKGRLSYISQNQQQSYLLIALTITLITSPSEEIYEAVSKPLKHVASDSASISSKTAAIHALGTCTFYGGASDDEILENMAYLLEIVSSDGDAISALDAPEPVAAALEEWGFLSTLIADLSLESEEAIETFADQLSSSDPAVQIAAGDNVALLYEKSYKSLESDYDLPEYSEEDIISDPDDVPGVPKLLQAYSPYHNPAHLMHTLSSLSTLSTHRIAKKDQKNLRTHFADVLNSIEHPTRGPRYQNAVNHETGKRYGSRLVVRIHRDGVMRIDKWWKLHRLQGLRRVLQGGFITHYEKNEVVFQSLP